MWIKFLKDSKPILSDVRKVALEVNEIENDDGTLSEEYTIIDADGMERLGLTSAMINTVIGITNSEIKLCTIEDLEEDYYCVLGRYESLGRALKIMNKIQQAIVENMPLYIMPEK
jgi:hypothetical protein